MKLGETPTHNHILDKRDNLILNPRPKLDDSQLETPYPAQRRPHRQEISSAAKNHAIVLWPVWISGWIRCRMGAARVILGGHFVQAAPYVRAILPPEIQNKGVALVEERCCDGVYGWMNEQDGQEEVESEACGGGGAAAAAAGELAAWAEWDWICLHEEGT